jgi:RNA polymerase sigma-70 factor (ECF subfamily)
MDQCTDITGFATVAARESCESMPHETADDELVRAVLAGDEAAFALLFERHRRLVTRLAYRFFYRREQVEDIVQESFAGAYFALNAYRGGQERSFMAWLSRITVRTCYDALRRSRRTESVMSELNQEEEALLAERLRASGKGNDIESKAISRDLAAKLLQRLEPDDRLVLTLLSVADLSVAETAEFTGWSVPKVKMRAHRARKALQRVLHRFV